jgi:hypothetical protein
MAGPIDIASSASFTGGLNGGWSFQYTSGAPDLFLQSITINLSPTDLAFDTYAGGTFGSLSSLDIGGISFTGPGTPSLLSGYASGLSLDGGTVVTFSFLDFAPGEGFQFSADVDHPNPALLSLLSCTGKTGLALLGCNATNASRTVTNDARLLAAETVGPNQMAGALVTFQFGGEGYQTTTVTGTFQAVTFQDVVNRLVSGDGAGAFNTNADVSAPEPASVATFGAGMGLLMALASRRRRRA